ncbi:TOMM precursor leader peptide-binding protein [Actinomadura sp. 9N215]|uniref:TOMM precursor leader peptide-binding protein n=1 Tax=Actinomadura sp. 9N215 TaxID=3375150 RepID=UPI003790F79B
MAETRSARATVTLAGDGSRLASAVGRALSLRFDLAEAPLPPPACAAVVAVTDRWRPDWFDLEKACEDLPWLPVHVELDRAIVGPWSVPGARGCHRCVARRRRAARHLPRERDALWARHADRLSVSSSPFCHGTGAMLVADLMAAQVELLIRNESAPTGSFLRVGLDGLDVSRHRFLPDPLCPSCGELPDDSREAARLVLRERPKPLPGVLRVSDLGARERTLLDLYVDAQAGVVRETGRDASAVLAGVLAVGADPRTGDTVNAYGQARDLRTARLTAVAEALERLGGRAPGGKRTVVRGSYRELRDEALDPRRFGLVLPDESLPPDSAFERYHDDLECSWVYGYSLTRAEPVLVPAAVAYYGRDPAREGDRPFLQETSNGSALGGSLEEAILHGLLEAVERDAFLITWYGRMSVPAVDPAVDPDRTIALTADWIHWQTGYELHLRRLPTDHGIPCFLGLALDPHDDPARPSAVCAAGSGLTAAQGLLGTLRELATVIEMRRRGYDAAARDTAARLAADPGRVATMADHSLLYCHPDALGRLDFLLSAPRTCGSGEIDEDAAWPPHADLRDDVAEAVRRLAACGLDVVVVDQTTPEQRAGGFACVKVLVPGLVPMTFGQHARRLDGLERLLRLPADLGYRDEPLTVPRLNPDPHPFP